MKRYIALFRGINISGKNKVAMAELKLCFESLNFADVKTYLNSGNVIFSCDETNIDFLTNSIEQSIHDKFKLEIPTFVILQEDLIKILQHAPSWWGSEYKEIYDNLIFVMPPATTADVHKEIGEPKIGLEKVQDYISTIFWSYSRKDYQKTNWWPKTASTAISKKLTIRTANTVRKISEM